ncbi:MAG: nitrate- and nitrite sensing domain-containing protein [Pseudonocardiaceae bacterium]
MTAVLGLLERLKTMPGLLRRVKEMTGSEGAQSRWYWRNWPVVVKLTAVLLVPTVVALVGGVLRIVDQASTAPAYARISQIAQMQQQLSDLIGAVARERDLATAFVAGGRLGDRRPLDLQFRAVDSSARVVEGSAGKIPRLDFTRSTFAALSSLEPLRASVATGFGPVEVVVTEYSDAIDPLIDLDVALTRQLDDVAVTNDAAAAHALVSGREQVSRQHAIVSAALYANRLGPGQIDDLRTAAVRLTTAQDAVRGALAPAERANATRVGGDAELSRQRLLQLVLNRGLAAEPLNTSPQEWDRRNTVVVDSISVLEKELRQRVDRTAQTLLSHVRTAAGLNSVILFFALALGVLVGIMVARALLRPLGVLKRTALDVADRRLPEAMARIRDGGLPEMPIEPVPVGTREEIGQVARAFDEVHSQAVRLASEQAQLRANVNDIFVNLSRRTQGLVERQLKLIDRLESGEQDPKQLDNLFQLDHLATRMRRNSENLLVLAGTDAASRSGQPVRLVDVLRAAVSEVEQYQRLVLQHPPAVLVLGRSASDLVHLLAELLDNATHFSPPDSQVMVSSESAADGSVEIGVADRGVGMTDAEFAETNERLATPPVVDASVSRRMGLFVVGRLASRHGIEVRLRRGEGGVGVWASVRMPPRLVRVASDVIEPGTAVAASDLAQANGFARKGVAALADASGMPAPRPDVDIDPHIGADIRAASTHQTNSNDGQPAGHYVVNDSANKRDDSDSEVSDSDASDSAAGDVELPQRIDTPSTSAVLPPAPPGPPASPSADNPVNVSDAGSGTELFRPVRATVAGLAGPGYRVTLQHSTPIFDDVASAWFKEHEAVPVRWTAPSAHGAAAPSAYGPTGVVREVPAREFPSPDAPLPNAPSPDGLLPDAPPLHSGSPQAPPSVMAGPPPLARRQPGKALAETDPSDAATSRAWSQPVPASGNTRPTGVPEQGWGAADEGWRAAEALAIPVSAEFTSGGLPRRQPRALLVPGTAGGAQPASAPVRSAESVRGRLASYQQGVREGRQARGNLDREVEGSPAERQDGAEEAK